MTRRKTVQDLLGPTPPRVLVVVAHPDDETIGAASLIARLPDCWLLHLTDGATRESRFIEGFAGDREEYAATRRQELAAAMALAGLGTERLISTADVADQEACLAMPYLAGTVVRLCRELGPEIVLTLTYEGGHPDHDAAAFAVRAAVERLRNQGEKPPTIVEMPLYHARPGMDVPVTQEFLQPEGFGNQVVRRDLSSAERILKLRMYDCFVTQRHILAWFLPAVHECFREAPVYDFTRPPHAGELQYELWGFPVTGERWRELARLAIAALELQPEAAPVPHRHGPSSAC
jgi:LmbE family N-acetylglucosaminyl deacetylase